METFRKEISINKKFPILIVIEKKRIEFIHYYPK